MKLLLLPPVSYQVFYHLPVHQRLPAEEIHLQVPTVPGVGDQEIQRLFPHFKAHQRPSSMVLSFFRETVAAGQVAVVGNVETESLHHRLALFDLIDQALICILCEQLSRPGQFRQIPKGLGDLTLRVLLLQRRGCCRRQFRRLQFLGGIGLFPGSQPFHQLIAQRVHHMDRAAVHIQDDLISVILILVNQGLIPLSFFLFYTTRNSGP